MDWSASKNLDIYNKTAFVFIWIFFILGCLCILASIICGIMTDDEWWFEVILPIGFGGILFAGLEWVGWAFTKGFQRIVEASEYQIYQVQKNDKQPITNK